MKDWFFSRKQKSSEKNRDLEIRRTLGKWEVLVSGTTQTGPFTASMWQDALKKTPERTVQKILLLGLGGAASVHSLHERFPEVNVTAIEYDSAMVEVAKEIGIYRPAPFPRVILGDVREVVPSLSEKFDLIILDVFEGSKLSPAFTDDSFLKALQARLNEGGVLMVNFSGHREAIKNIADRFPKGIIWTFRANTLGAFW